jgi:serine/threonine-protein kinase
MGSVPNQPTQVTPTGRTTDPPAEFIGTRYGKYVLVRKLAEGGMAEIFLAKQRGPEGFERNVVIKRMLKHLSDEPDFVTMFLDEARLAAQLGHPNIVQLHDLGYADGFYFICMEYLPGEDLAGILRAAVRQKIQIPIDIAVRSIAAAAQGLHFAHEFADESGKPLNIVHRDISPSNVFLTYQGQIKVLDFGIAKAEIRIARTATGVVKGKYNYMSPEQARGENVDRRADIHALGVVLYEALTLTKPFARENDMALLNAILSHDFAPPHNQRPDVAPGLERVILKAMSAKPEERYQTAREMAVELAGFVSPGAPSAEVQVSDFMARLFGEERKTAKMRIPTLENIMPGLKDMEHAAPLSKSARETVVGRPQTTPAPGPMPSEVKRLTQKSRLPQFLGVAALALALGGLGLALRGSLGAAGIGSQPWLPPPAQPPASPEPNKPAASVEPTPPSPVPAPSPPHAETPVPSTRPGLRADPPSHAPRVLEASDVERVVSRGRTSMLRCFQTHRDDLPSEAARLEVRVTVLGSGRAQAQTQPPFRATPVGNCLEQEVQRLKFPSHRDKEVSFTLPLDYRPVAP